MSRSLPPVARAHTSISRDVDMSTQAPVPRWSNGAGTTPPGAGHRSVPLSTPPSDSTPPLP